ncbi:hypothetical protein BV898_04824 [Hypsibius exemplaris]|uniref:Uncharacterized protein n=1 Tax=Hypsibius exemplaris TaxID=2072580 RepID=A0A1W0X1K5_HYPEX|nr:hypothetical protein BV898_04824 [Hypsibius exemplaris]
MNKSPNRRCNDRSYTTATPTSLKTGVRSARQTAETDPCLGSEGGQPFKAQESKMLFLAEHGCVLTGGTLCFLMGAMVSLVIVWIIILICNRQIAVERIGAQTKIAGLYGEFHSRSQTNMKPFVDLVKLFNCSTQTFTTSTDYRLVDVQTALALSNEAGMKYIQDIVNQTTYNGLFASIFTAALIMLLIEILCIFIFLAYKNNWHGLKDRTCRDLCDDDSNTKYSFLIQGPRVLHHGVFEVAKSLSTVGMHVKSFLTRAGQSFCPSQDEPCLPGGPRLPGEPRYEQRQTTEMTITVQPQSGLTRIQEEDDPLLGRGNDPKPNHPLTRHPYRPNSVRRCDDNNEAADRSAGRDDGLDIIPPMSDLQSSSVGLQTLREHLEKCRLLVWVYPDLDTTNGSVRPDGETTERSVQLDGETTDGLVRPDGETTDRQGRTHGKGGAGGNEGSMEENRWLYPEDDEWVRDRTVGRVTGRTSQVESVEVEKLSPASIADAVHHPSEGLTGVTFASSADSTNANGEVNSDTSSPSSPVDGDQSGSQWNGQQQGGQFDVQAPVPSVKAAVPSTEAPVPMARAAVPSTEAPVPMARAAVPSTEAPVPMARAAVPSTEAPVPSVRALHKHHLFSFFMLLVFLNYKAVALIGLTQYDSP